MREPSIAFVLGTRPELIKCAPIMHEADRRDLPYSVVHTGQHYSDRLTTVFYDQLEIRRPDHDLGVGSGSHGQQTGQIMAAVDEVLRAERPDVVLVQGDTNSVLAGALVASKLDARLGHVEAGLRSYDRSMPEEINRIVADHLSDYLYAPTETAADNLRNEGRPEAAILQTGNTIVDAVQRHRELARSKSTVHEDLDVEPGTYVLMTVHRAENVDEKARFEDILTGVDRAAERMGVEVLYPIHPRAVTRLDEFGIEVPSRIRTVEPQDYLDFLALEGGAKLIVTDSGGIQEEACILGVPCVTVRDSTERPETVDIGANALVGMTPAEIVAGAVDMVEKPPTWSNPYGDGDAAARILSSLASDGQGATCLE
jgi:UDP-N-acetylglucosamine 2-epimerase (non-hydrolysing)